MKTENSLLAIFDKIPCTIAHSLEPNFGATLKIHKNAILSSNFLHNIYLSRCTYMYQKILS